MENITQNSSNDHDRSSLNLSPGTSQQMANPSNSPQQHKVDQRQFNNIVTNKPYTIPNRKKQIFRSLYSKENTTINEIYPNFIILKSLDENKPLTKCCQFNIYKEFSTNYGKPKAMWGQNDGSLVVELYTCIQYKKVNKMTTLGGVNISIKSHPTLNVTKGVITSKQMQQYGYSNEELKEHLKDQFVTDVYQIITYINKIKIPSPTYILSFSTSQLPEKIHCGYEYAYVRPYISRPRRCTKCQKFGHSKLKCRGTEICVNCAQAHTDMQCKNDPLCANCGDPHSANNIKCLKYLYEKDILAIRDTEKISYQEARRKVNNRFVRPGITFADALSTSKPVNRFIQKTRKEQSDNQNSKLTNTEILKDLYVDISTTEKTLPLETKSPSKSKKIRLKSPRKNSKQNIIYSDSEWEEMIEKSQSNDNTNEKPHDNNLMVVELDPLDIHAKGTPININSYKEKSLTQKDILIGTPYKRGLDETSNNRDKNHPYKRSQIHKNQLDFTGFTTEVSHACDNPIKMFYDPNATGHSNNQNLSNHNIPKDASSRESSLNQEPIQQQSKEENKTSHNSDNNTMECERIAK